MNSSTLIIIIKKAEFVNVGDNLDPFVRVSIEKERQQTKVLIKDKNPTWNETLKFKISNNQISKADNVNILIEAMSAHSDIMEYHIGKNVHLLSKILNKPSHLVSLDLIDKSYKFVGTIQAEFELRNELRSPVSNKKVTDKSKVIGTLAVKPKGAQFNNDVVSQDPYLIFIHGNEAYQTSISYKGGKNPTWADIISFQLIEGEDLQVKCFDNDPTRDEMIGEVSVELSQYYQFENNSIVISLTNANGKKIGQLLLDFDFLDDIFDNPVKIFSTVEVKKGSYLSKKIKYNNPDRFTKELEIKSSNPSVIFVKTPELKIGSNENGNIRLKILAPTNKVNERCRIDIKVKGTNKIEESLSFHLRLI